MHYITVLGQWGRLSSADAKVFFFKLAVVHITGAQVLMHTSAWHMHGTSRRFRAPTAWTTGGGKGAARWCWDSRYPTTARPPPKSSDHRHTHFHATLYYLLPSIYFPEFCSVNVLVQWKTYKPSNRRRGWRGQDGRWEKGGGQGAKTCWFKSGAKGLDANNQRVKHRPTHNTLVSVGKCQSSLIKLLLHLEPRIFFFNS